MFFYDSNRQFCYYKLIVKRAFSVMTPTLLFKFYLPLISPLIVRPVIINLHVWLFQMNSWYVLVLLYRLPDITFNKSLDVMLRYCVTYICNNEVLCIFLEHKFIMISVRLQMCEEYLNGHQGVHMGQYSVLIVFPFNSFVYYTILGHIRPIITSIYATVDYGLDLTHIHSLTTNVKLLFLRSCIISNPTINDLFYDQMNNMLLIIVKNNINIQILYVTHLPYLKHILWHFINVCTYSQLLTTQELSLIIKDENNKVKMHCQCTIDYYYRLE